MLQIDHNTVLEQFPDRRPESHKGDFGKLLFLCGSVGYTGAAELAAKGALRTGAGLVFLGVPESIYMIEAIKLTEPVVFPLPEKNGMICEEALDTLLPRLSGMDAVLMGPGLGRSSGVERVICRILREYTGPVVLDADGINVMEQHKDILRERTGPTILTPHEGEFTRFAGMQPEGREDSAMQLACDVNSIVVLKGHRTVITDGSRLYCNPTGNPGMAVGGSGDILAGIITSLLGQKLDPLMAAVCGAWLHGAAGDICAERMGQYGMVPSDMLDVLPRLLK